MKHLSLAELEAGLDEVRRSPRDAGPLEMIVRRPEVNERETLESGELDLAEGLVGDSWTTRYSPRSAKGGPHPDTQVTIMNSRLIALVAGAKSRWPLAGDQLYVDLDLSDENLPAGAQLAIGAAVVEITDQPHLGCRKFATRFGRDAVKFVNSPVGKRLRLRGVNAKVVAPGAIRVGDGVRKVAGAALS